MEDTVIIPLSAIDHFGMAACSTTYGYVLDSVNETKVKNVASRVVEKWRLLAGRLEWNSSTRMYHIRVPVGKLPNDYARVTFTRTEYPEIALEHDSLTLHDNSAVFLSRPPLEYFRHSSTPDGLDEYASRQLPLLSIHVSVLKNRVCVGFLFAHGAFDGTGMGMIARAFNDEFNGREWKPPALQTDNLLAKVAARSPVNGKNSSSSLCRMESTVASLGVSSGAAFAGKLLYEKLWHGVEYRAIFLGNDVVDRLVVDIKQQVISEGKGFVSTGDVLLAWAVKAAYQTEGATSEGFVALNSAMCIRSVLQEATAKDYAHNAFSIVPTPEIRVRDLAVTSPAYLAVLHRKSLEDCRNIAYFEGYYALAQRLGNMVPRVRWGAERWISSNQITSRMDLLDLGVETRQFFSWSKPYVIHHGIILNRFRDGYIVEMSMRRSRWNSLAVELEKLNQEHASKE